MAPNKGPKHQHLLNTDTHVRTRRGRGHASRHHRRLQKVIVVITEQLAMAGEGRGVTDACSRCGKASPSGG